jgi:hypothetical protein
MSGLVATLYTVVSDPVSRVAFRRNPFPIKKEVKGDVFAGIVKPDTNTTLFKEVGMMGDLTFLEKGSFSGNLESFKKMTMFHPFVLCRICYHLQKISIFFVYCVLSLFM